MLLEFFRWDIESMERLPEYMKICFLALYNTTNKMGNEILKDQGLNILPYLHKVVLHHFFHFLVHRIVLVAQKDLVLSFRMIVFNY